MLVLCSSYLMLAITTTTDSMLYSSQAQYLLSIHLHNDLVLVCMQRWYYPMDYSMQCRY